MKQLLDLVKLKMVLYIMVMEVENTKPKIFSMLKLLKLMVSLHKPEKIYQNNWFKTKKIKKRMVKILQQDANLVKLLMNNLLAQVNMEMPQRNHLMLG